MADLPEGSRINVVTTGSRKHGATQKQFQEFIRAADAGLRVEMHGQNYVAMSRNIYDELRRAANPIVVTTDEAADLSDAEIEKMNELISKHTLETISSTSIKHPLKFGPPVFPENLS